MRPILLRVPRGLMNVAAAACIGLPLLAGCAGSYRRVDPGIDHTRHLIEVDRHGAFVEVERDCRGGTDREGPRECRLRAGERTGIRYTREDFAETERRLDEHLTAIFHDVIEYKEKRFDDGKTFRGILFFVHGGLNSEQARFTRVLRDTEKIREAGYYPIFISWNSGPFSTYAAHLFRVRQGRRVSLSFGIVTSPIWLLGDLARVAAAIPVGWYQQLSGHVYGVVNQPFLALAGKIRPEWGGAPRLPPHSGYDCATEAPEFGAARVCIAGRDDKPRYWWPFRTLTQLVTFPSKLVTTPVVLGIGGRAWGMMLRRARTVLHSVDEFEPADPKRTEPIYPDGSGTVSQVVERLLELQIREDAKGNGETGMASIPITMVGHSMGAIIINQILLNYPELQIHDIVYMAAAAAVGDTADAVYPYLERHPNAKFYSLVLHPYADRRELSVFGLAPSGSLLQWIDEVYGDPVNATDRRVGKWENVENLLYKVPTFDQGPPHLDEQARRRVHIKVFGFDRKCDSEKADQKKCDPLFDHPVKHGDFSERPYWDPRFWGHPDSHASQ